MGRASSNELARSGQTVLGEHGVKNKVDESHQQDDSTMGPVPEENQPGHRPDEEHDQPTNPPA